MQGPDGVKNAYVATQGPLQHTIQDFLRGIWQLNSKLIVMLCALEEPVPGPGSTQAMKPKCSRYWPTTVGQELFFGVFGIKLVRYS